MSPGPDAGIYARIFKENDGQSTRNNNYSGSEMERTLVSTKDRKYVSVDIVSQETERMNLDTYTEGRSYRAL